MALPDRPLGPALPVRVVHHRRRVHEQQRSLVAGNGLDPSRGVGDTARPTRVQDQSGPVEGNRSSLVGNTAIPARARPGQRLGTAAHLPPTGSRSPGRAELTPRVPLATGVAILRSQNSVKADDLWRTARLGTNLQHARAASVQVTLDETARQSTVDLGGPMQVRLYPGGAPERHDMRRAAR